MLETSLTLLVFLFPLAYSPGPGNLFFAANGARFGPRATIPANLGYHAATWVVAVAIGLGFTSVLEKSAGLFEVIRYAGALYVLLIAWRFFVADTLRGGADPRPAGAVDGAVLLLLNPKAYVIMVLMFSQFLPEFGRSETAAVWIATVFTLNNLLAFVVWTMIGDRIAAVFADSRDARWLNRLAGLLLAGVALWMLAG